jgi:hypothetical protein
MVAWAMRVFGSQTEGRDCGDRGAAEGRSEREFEVEEMAEVPRQLVETLAARVTRYIDLEALGVL